MKNTRFDICQDVDHVLKIGREFADKDGYRGAHYDTVKLLCDTIEHLRESVGNAVVMREALENVQDSIDKWREEGAMEHWQYSQLFDICDAAIAKPPRNCDIGSVEEQINRHCKWCATIKDFSCATTMCRRCFAKWSQMPYDKGEN